MNGKRGRCALCTINKKEIKIMKQFKKLVARVGMGIYV